MLQICQSTNRCLLLEVAQKHLTQTQTQSCQQLGLAVFDGPTFIQAIDQLIAAKRAANRKERYIVSLRYYLEQFSKGRQNTPLADFTTPDIEAWMQKFSGAYARQTWLNRLSTLFSWAVRRRLIASNPCDCIERVSIDRKPPMVLTPQQADLLLRIAPNLCRPYLIIGLYAGVRPEEIIRMNWSDINLETKTLRIDGKGRRPRIVPLEPKAVALLSKCPLQKGDVTPSNTTLCRFKIKARAALGLIRWPQDLLRHTAASYLLALHGDAGKVATNLGNSPKILLTHYHQPVTKSDCEQFWATE